ncbi:MAG: tyrosine-type recombinase/integrase [Pseudaminobacter sp.]
MLLLKRLLQRHPRAPNERLFVSRYGEPLGARLKVAAYVKAAAAPASILRTKQVTPHSFRHGTTVHLVSAGADATVSGCCSSAHG